jgi:glucose/arabinose dehydrogenase
MNKYLLPVYLLVLMLLITACSVFVDAPASTPTLLPTFSPATPAPGGATEPSPIPPPTETQPAAATASPVADTPAVDTPAVETPVLDPPASPTPSNTPAPSPSPTPEPLFVDRFPNPDDYHWVPVASGINRPVGLENAGDGSDRLFVLEQPGVIRLVKDGQLVQRPFLDIRDRVGSQASEQGLLGLAFHPDYSQNGYFFVNYTDRSGDTSISRFRVSADPDLADPATEQRLLSISQPFGNHNGGVVKFGPDGYLYLGLGDGGSGGDPRGFGQSLNTLLGKILRIDIDTESSYKIPESNPFANGGGEPEIWAYGLRNPWRLSFDRLTGDMYIADVGQNAWEEVNFQPASSPGGENYGWNIMEGLVCFGSASCNTDGLVMPVHVYPTRQEGNCSVTGGYVYRGSRLPEFYGIYIFGDYCSGRVWGLLPENGDAWDHTLLFETGASLTSFGEDEDGEIYLVNHRNEILRLEAR